MTRKKKITVDEWRGAYPSNWKGVVVPEAISHPAKYSSKLIRRIYEHMIEQGWVHEGDRVLDPFGGVALGALDALRLGLDWTGIELEEKFYKLGSENISKWGTQYGSMPHWGTARLLHGDSRYLLSVIGESVQVSVSSPPYADSDQDYKGGWKRFHDGHEPLHKNDIQREAQYGTTDGQLSAMPANQFDAAISSPPFLQSEGGTPEPKPNGTIDAALYKRHAAGNAKANGYGDSNGQLSSMRDGGFDAAVSSPPYNPPMSQDHNGKRGGKRGTTPSESGAFVKYGNTEGQLEGMNMEGFDAAISSPPYSAMQVDKNAKSINREKQYETYKKSGGGQSFEQFCHTQELHSQGYGNSDGQLSSMPANSFNAALSSPPYAEARIGQESGQEHCGHHDQYGENTGQLGAMPADEFTAAVSSPPYEAQVIRDRDAGKEGFIQGTTQGKHAFDTYGHSDGQLGNDSGDDFWLAARAIVEQVYQALAPGGHAVWVVKDYVKNKQIVPFSAQWRQLCEAVGFVTLHEHHAMLVHHKGTQHTLEGGTVEHKTESKSFFRRLAEKKGSPRIDFETVFCMEKPQ